MRSRNISNLIEHYLKKIMADDDQIEIRRSSIAHLFNVVPSQINYVIRTRFTIPNGYLVESKRGGGGYIRIEHVKLLDNLGILDLLTQVIGTHLSEKKGVSIVHTLVRHDILSHKEANIVIASISKRTLCIGNTALENEIRARILISILNHLRYES
ncbi:CtsR family transcriptional regulator [Acetilactobacillus jinshanensis]|uniref:Transcriptional regulator CtsR n=1 Tax=Acetilactobacillus jinshanensis TaxID=1720083 RepID=A0A4P6ZJL7_9LACO|nr:CtsR family transcriptional regulator [Acetilactobacillus jinshanensis]QBP17814.1 CtsR family transcriptional regulator [Acetilactobacillus jinshanensis]URL60676.1 CtsR family transcriptional regulator [uncultured bacterium]